MEVFWLMVCLVISYIAATVVSNLFMAYLNTKSEKTQWIVLTGIIGLFLGVVSLILQRLIS